MFNKKLIELRKNLKISQYELANRLGFSRGKIANYEQGSRQPDFDTLEKIADFFDVSTDYLLGREESQTNPKMNTSTTLFGERLRNLRKNETSLTMKELGKRIGVSESAVGMYERGEREPDMEVIGRIADVFGVTVDYLLGRSDYKDYTAVDDEDFNRFKNDPSLEKWYKELPESKDEDLRKLRKMWEILRDNGEI